MQASALFVPFVRCSASLSSAQISRFISDISRQFCGLWALQRAGTSFDFSSASLSAFAAAWEMST